MLAASIAAWWCLGDDLLGWVLFAGAFPLIFEARAWQQAALFASLRYAVDESTFYSRAYELKDALPRLALLYCWLFGILVAREMKSLPDDGWIVVILAGPVVIWTALTMHSYYRRVRIFVVQNGIAKRRGKPWR